MSQSDKSVFISYRISASSFIARAIYQDLTSHGYDVFMDVESIGPGKFNSIILNQILARPHFLVICSPGTFDRINEPGDWVRREIEFAMANERNIVPVRVNDFDFKTVSSILTGELATFQDYNAPPLRHDSFDDGMRRLRERFLVQSAKGAIVEVPAAERTTVAEKQREIASQPAPTPKQLTAEDRLNKGIEYALQLDSEHAIAELTEAIRLNPQYAAAYRQRAIVRMMPKSETVAQAGNIRFQVTNIDVSQRGPAAIPRVDLDGAIADYNEAIRLNSQHSRTYYLRSEAREAKEDFAGAQEDLQRYLDLGGSKAGETREQVEAHIKELQKKAKQKKRWPF